MTTHTVAQALAHFRNVNQLDPDPDAGRWWACKIGSVSIRFPNFPWRRKAVLRHDLHHMMTGYPLTMKGEFQMAAWEFAAGRFPNVAASLFCLPLVIAGIILSPRLVWTAFLAGRNSNSLYRYESTEELLAQPLANLRAEIATEPVTAFTSADLAAFARLLIQSLAVVIIPMAVIIATLA